MNDDDRDTLIAELAADGYLEPVFHEDGSVTAKVVPFEGNPLWHIHLEELEQDIRELIEAGLAEIVGKTPDGKLLYAPTAEGRKVIGEES